MTCVLRPKSNELESRAPEWIANVAATDRVGKERSPKEQRETVGSLDTLCWD